MGSGVGLPKPRCTSGSNDFQDILGVGVTGYWNAETDTEFLAVRQAHLMS
jgi:hypothetical protein